MEQDRGTKDQRSYEGERERITQGEKVAAERNKE